MGNEEREGALDEREPEDEERTGLAERKRQDQEKADVNRERQQRQGVVSEVSEDSEAPEEAA